tara:strand:+ start:76 stop:2067 length:1992 start_codon:yes stop_codon:yes gene_type:complete
MFNKIYILATLIFFVSCSSTQDLTPQKSNSSSNDGITPILSDDFPFPTSSTQGLAKLYKGNSAHVNGVFISKDGLFLTNYSSVLEYMASASQPDNSFFQKGIAAPTKNDEIPLQGISLLIEIEQTDITEEVRKEITDLSPNFEIFQSIQKQKNLLINERRGDRTDLLVEIQDSYSGLKHLMTVYAIIKDVRLVYAPSLNIDKTNSSSSEYIFNEITDEYAILRAYKAPDGSSKEYSPENIPYSPNHHFPISLQEPENASSLIALGFPNKTYRLETSRAIRFYNEQLNPTIISSYRIYLEKEDTLAFYDDNYSLKSIPNRFNIAQNVQFYKTAQDMISEYDVINTKAIQEQEFLKWVESDSSLPQTYSQLLDYVNQAYDIAEQTSDIYFTSNYFNNFSFLDNLASIYSSYIKSLESINMQTELDSLRNVTLQSHQNLLSQTNVNAELFMLKKFLLSFATVQEQQKPLILFDLFNETAGTDLEAFSIHFVDEIAPISFLFDLDKAQEALLSNSLYSDPLFGLLDEILFTHDSSYQSYILHYAYLFPAQQVYNRARLEQSFTSKIKPDATSLLSFNVGGFNHTMSSSDDSYFYTTNDFSGKTPGTALLNTTGELIGIVTDEINHSVLGNYVYSEKSSFLKALKITFILEELNKTVGTEKLLEELGH